MSRLLEDDIKNAILNNKQLLSELGDLGQTRVIFEKSVDYHRLIADALLFTHKRGIIGIEIKTQYDTLARLPKQLDSYTRVCNYVFVFCHDSHLQDVLKLIKDKHYNYVGVISYDDFQGDVVAGLVKPASSSKRYSLKVAVSMLWKKEIYNILKTYYTQPEQVIRNTYNSKDKHMPYANRQHIPSKAPGVVHQNYHFKKLLSIYMNTFDKKEGTRILCDVFITKNYDPEKNLQMYNLGDKYTHDTTF